MDLPEPPRPDLRRLPPPQPPPSQAPKKGFNPSLPVTLAIIAASLIVLGVIGYLNESDSGGGSSGSDGSSDALIERTCEIARDISADVSDGVDTIPEARERFKDLLDGYGEAAPPDIAGPLRQVVSSLTTGETTQLQVAVGDLDSACASRGF
jgi:hypothetical protein